VLLRRIDGENATIPRGTVRFGGPAAEPARNGLWVTGAVKALDLDRWLALLQQADGGAPLEAGGMDLKLGTVDMLGRRFNELAVNANIQRGQWRVVLKGSELDGTVTWLPQGAGRLSARMNTLAVPPASPTAAEPASDDVQARKEQKKLPELDIVAEQFINKGKPLGRLEAAAVPEENAWRIDRLRLSNSESTFTVDGSWQFGAARPRTHVNVHVEASDIGALLARFGYPEGVKGGTAKLDGSLAWTGAPYELDVPSLTGNFAMEAAKGQFVKLDPGIGKLLGVMSLQALPRRMSLDFKDVFSEGFAFDEIAGTVHFNRGTATTDNLRIRGPAAQILMRGDVDLDQETQDIRVRITPHVMETVSVAGALVGGPIAGVATYLFQQVLRDPFGKLITYEYGVTGSWSDPVVKRMTRPLAVPEAEGKFE
ncbi:MAG: YhdP family protein, partial [Burkholderiales bacterium]